jgi:hypothetical protein
MYILEEGMVVYANKDIDQPASGDGPGCRLAAFGDKLIIREIDEFKGRKQYAVSHEHVTDRAFYVYRSEISIVKPFSHNYRG